MNIMNTPGSKSKHCHILNFLCLVLSFDLVIAVNANKQWNVTLTLGLSIPWDKGLPIGQWTGSGIVIGIEEIYRRQILPGYDVNFVFRDSRCEPRRGMQTAVDMWASEDTLVAFIGDACSTVCQPLALLAAAWNIPVVSWGCTSGSLSDKKTYPTFTRVDSTWRSLAPVLNSLADVFNWNRVAILTTSEDIWKLTAIEAHKEMQKNGKYVIWQIFESTVRGQNVDMRAMSNLRQILTNLKKEAKIIFIMAYISDLRNILILALEEHMLNGQYVFMAIEYKLVLNIESNYRPHISKETLYNGLMGISLKEPSGQAFESFLEDVLEAFDNPIFANVPVAKSVDELSPYAGMIHDAVLQWAYGVNKTLQQGYGVNDGFMIANNIINMTFQGITGTVVIDHNGDRKPDYIIDIYQSGEFIPLLEWLAAESSMKMLFKPEQPGNWSGIIWPGNGTDVPKDSTHCGWDRVLCDTDEANDTSFIIIYSVAAVAVLFILFVGVYIIKYIRFENILKDIEMIKISWKDIANVQISQHIRDTSNGQMIAISYKDVMLAMYPLQGTTIDLQNRKTLIDIKEMRDLRNDNVNGFAGVCIDRPNVAYFMLHAERGSLWDILESQEPKLDFHMKISILDDIASGMSYLHLSPIKYHGALTSSKCVVDSRWTCKVNGHGLRFVKCHSGSLLPEYIENNSVKLLWTAPERLGECSHADEDGYRKGDVYSFAIIGQEVILQAKPYAENDEYPDTKAIIRKIMDRSSPPYRPHLPDSAMKKEFVTLLEGCWDENPDDRPKFSKILTCIDKIHSMKNVSLVDNMIHRLASYTNTLEEKVAERTKELNDERYKMKAILKELLPVNVAEALVLGNKVDPEIFENVTIFFSDIVEFTSISAQSNAMQIVHMLNDMYTMFDDIAHNFDVYKVATIGDAYMVASGVPIRNGDEHAVEICSMAVALLDAIQDFSIPHLTNQHLYMRIGVHSGPCVAGVTGIKMPRYLLFGDTVDIAARMESSGEAMKIHVSETTEVMLKDLTLLNLEYRGEVDVKGKRVIQTYWLTNS